MKCIHSSDYGSTIPFILPKIYCLFTAGLISLAGCSPQVISPTIAPTIIPTLTATALPPTSTFTSAPPTPSPTPQGLTPPIRAAFYYPYSAQDWQTDTANTLSRFTPPSGLYTTNDQMIVETHIRQMQYGGIQAAILTGRGSSFDRLTQLEGLMNAAQAPGFYWSLELTPSSDDPGPDPATLLDALYKGLADRQEYLKISGKPVLFLRLDGDVCSLAQPWLNAKPIPLLSCGICRRGIYQLPCPARRLVSDPPAR